MTRKQACSRRKSAWHRQSPIRRGISVNENLRRSSVDLGALAHGLFRVGSRFMKADVLAGILGAQKGVRSDGSAYLLDDNVAATVLCSTGGELVTVPRVNRLELGKEVCIL